MVLTVAFDSGLFRVGRGDKVFKAPIGAGITVSDVAKFRSCYDEALNELFRKYNADRRKRVYKASHIYTQFVSEAPVFMDDFLRRISTSIKQVDFFYTYFNTVKLPKIVIFRDSGKEVRTPTEFINLIQNSYHHLCAWRYLMLYPDTKDCNYYLDHFSPSYATPAWSQINTLSNLSVYYHGDECNCFLATADIITRVASDKIKLKRRTLIDTSIKEVLSSILGSTDVRVHFLGGKTEYLHFMAPNVKLPINLAPKLKHPIIFTVGAIKDKFFEWSPLFCSVLNMAHNKDYAVKNFNPSQDVLILRQSEDILVPFQGEEELNLIKRAGFTDIKVLTRDEILARELKISKD